MVWESVGPKKGEMGGRTEGVTVWRPPTLMKHLLGAVHSVGM